MAYRRQREGRTDYRLRLRLLKSRKPRLVVRRSATGIIVQLVEYAPDGDRVRATVHSRILTKYGWSRNPKNLPAAFLAGYLLGRKVRKLGIEEAVVDLGLQHAHPRGRLYAAVKGAVQAGLLIPRAEDVIPPEDRLQGMHIADDIPSMVERVRAKIDESIA